jgi:glycosyltransferase involved in cell wall biosynthesis
MGFMFSPEARRQMQHAIRIFEPDVAHLHIYYGQLTASILRPLLDARIPIVQTLHEYKLVCATHGLYANGQFCDACQGRHHWRALMTRCNRGSISRSLLSMAEAYFSEILGSSQSVDRFIAVSDFQRNHLLRLGVPRKKLSRLYHFCDVEAETPVQIGKYLLFVGRISAEKGIGVLLEAYRTLGEDAPPLKVVGTGADVGYWKDWCERNGISDKVEWLGFKVGTELQRIYRGCIALVNPTVLNETFGLTCLEALAQGRPVIASSVGAIPEVVDDDIDGYLVAPASSQELGMAIEKMINDPVTSLKMGRLGRDKVAQRFSKQAHYKRLIKLYSEVM